LKFAPILLAGLLRILANRTKKHLIIINMNNVIELAKQCPDVTISLKAGELLEMVEYCVQSTKKALEQQITDSNTETYPSPEQVSKILNVDKSTLWRWNKSNYLKPIEVGGKRRYKMSDINLILNSKVC
jgi:hypothetical protein